MIEKARKKEKKKKERKKKKKFIMTLSSPPVQLAGAKMSLESCGLAPLPGENRGAHKDRVRDAIQEWNANRLDLFEITPPNDDLEFFGAMRFYFQVWFSRLDAAACRCCFCCY